MEEVSRNVSAGQCATHSTLRRTLQVVHQSGNVCTNRFAAGLPFPHHTGLRKDLRNRSRNHRANRSERISSS